MTCVRQSWDLILHNLLNQQSIPTPPYNQAECGFETAHVYLLKFHNSLKRSLCRLVTELKF